MEELVKQENQNQQSGNHIKYDGSYLILLLYRYKWFIIITVIIASSASVFFSLRMPNWYSATVNTVPSQSQGGIFDNMMGGLSSALKEFGMTKLGGQSGESYDFIVLMQSRTLKDSLIDKFNLADEYEIPDSMRSKIYSALEDNIEITYEKEGNYTVTILSKNRHKAVDMVYYFINVVNWLAQKVAHEDASMNRKYLEDRIIQTDSLIVAISDSLSKFSKKNLLFSVEEQAKASSTAYADLKSELIKQETIYEMYKNRFGQNDAFTKTMGELVNSLRSKLDDAIKLPGFSGNFSMENAAGVGIEFVRLSAEYETFTKVKSLLMPMLEEARLEEIRKTQSLIVVDSPILADKKVKPKRSLIVLGFVFGTFFVCIIFVVLLDGYKNFRKRYKILKNNYQQDA